MNSEKIKQGFQLMDITNHLYQVQDSTKKTLQLNTGSIGNSLQIERKSIEIADIRTLQVDSSRIQKPKVVRPVVKTIPYIPETDSIQHPAFNVLNESFTFPQKKDFFDQLHINPLNPELQFEYTGAAAKAPVPKNEKSKIIEIPVKEHLTALEKNTQSQGFNSTDWMLGVIIFLWIVFGWLRVGFGRFFQTAIQASYNYFAARRIYEEANVVRSRVFYFMNILFFMNLALFVSQWLDFYNYTFYDLEFSIIFLLVLIGLLIIYGVKGLFLNILDFLFLTKGHFASYNTTVFIYNKMIGFILLPVVSFIPYVPLHVVPWLFKGAVIVIILLYIMRIFRGIQVGFKIRLSIFYLILYLCALEILPVLMLYKIAKSFI